MKNPYIWDIEAFMLEDPAYGDMPDNSGIWAEMMLYSIMSEVRTTNPDKSE
jgi:hypothetical protein